jgi:hypothetical protein
LLALRHCLKYAEVPVSPYFGTDIWQGRGLDRLWFQYTQADLSIAIQGGTPLKETVIVVAASHPARLHLFLHQQRRAQFWHYELLLQRIVPGNSKWIAFCDDDDLRLAEVYGYSCTPEIR